MFRCVLWQLGYILDMAEPTLRAYDSLVEGNNLLVVIRKEFDFGNLHQDWAHQIIRQYPGPYATVRIDLSSIGLVSSTFFAGLLQFYFHYVEGKSSTLTLMKPDSRVIRNLAVMRMEKFFRIEPR